MSIQKDLEAKMPPADQRPGWDKLEQGAVVSKAGNGRDYQTGDWRSSRPVIDSSKCINCFFCWVFCPDASIAVKDQKVVGIDYYHCKGCGICAHECPKKAIDMIDEETAVRQEEAAASQKANNNA
jgi:pyruvate ferredoxin oxidoreductase delta subunit